MWLFSVDSTFTDTLTITYTCS